MPVVLLVLIGRLRNVSRKIYESLLGCLTRICKNGRSRFLCVSASGAHCANGRYFLHTVVSYIVYTLLLGSDFDIF